MSSKLETETTFAYLFSFIMVVLGLFLLLLGVFLSPFRSTAPISIICVAGAGMLVIGGIVSLIAMGITVFHTRKLR